MASNNFSYEFYLEQQFDYVAAKSWASKNTLNVVAIGVFYVILIKIGEKYMSKRPGYKLKLFLSLWNGLLATFSIFGAIRVMPDFLHSLQMGFNYSICDSSNLKLKVTGFWLFAFMLSKVVELFDTAFLVLRKRPVIFLHWYHHFTVMILTWFSAVNPIMTATLRWYATMNFAVHSMMYSYYTLTSCGIRLPRFIAIVITTLQIAQMIGGIFVTLSSLVLRLNGYECPFPNELILMFSAVYFSYFLLFCHFFYHTYLATKPKISGVSKRETTNNNVEKMANGNSKISVTDMVEESSNLMNGSKLKRN